MRTLRRLGVAAAICLVFLLIAIPVLIAEGSLHIINRPAADSRAADYLARVYDAPWRSVSIATPDGVRFAAWFFAPNQANGGAVLLLHGVADTRLGMTGHAGYLLRAGYSILLPDSRGHGASGGNLITYGLKEAGDAAQWAQWMAAQPGIGRTYALGESMGAANLIQSLAMHPGFSAVVAERPFARFSEVAVYRVSQRFFGLPAPLARMVVSEASWYTQDTLRLGPDARFSSCGKSRERFTSRPWAAEPQAYQRRVRAWFATH